MPTKVERTGIEWAGQIYLPNVIKHSFVCAECGGPLRATLEDDYEVFLCSTDPLHDGIEHAGFRAKRLAWQKEMELEAENDRRAELLRTAREHFPAVAEALNRKGEEAAELLWPRNEGL